MYIRPKKIICFSGNALATSRIKFLKSSTHSKMCSHLPSVIVGWLVTCAPTLSSIQKLEIFSEHCLGTTFYAYTAIVKKINMKSSPLEYFLKKVSE